MGRKNYRTRESRRRHVVEYTPVERRADWSVIMTNGSGVKKIIISGTSVSAWNYAIRLGMNEDDVSMPGVWWPIDVTFYRDNDETFSII